MAPNTAQLQEPCEPRFDWNHYNQWQTHEAALVIERLRDLVQSSTIHDWKRRNGRPRVPRRTVILCLVVKAYLNICYRRLTGLLRVLQHALGLDHVPHFNTLARYNRRAGITHTLQRLLAVTAEPYWNTEKVLAADATGLVLQGTGAWRRNKRDDSRRDFAKIHVLNGTKSRATLAVHTTRGTWHDSRALEPLLDQVPNDATARALTADTAYWTRRLCHAIKDAGVQPYFKPKKNARYWKWPKDAFEKMTRFAQQFPNRFASVYHKRPTSESRFATEKLLFGDRLRCKRPASRRNEVLAREIAHNVRLLTRDGL